MSATNEYHYRFGYHREPEWLAARLTELLLKGFTWKSARNALLIEKDQFDRLLDKAVHNAVQDQQRIEATYGPVEKRLSGVD